MITLWLTLYFILLEMISEVPFQPEDKKGKARSGQLNNVNGKRLRRAINSNLAHTSRVLVAELHTSQRTALCQPYKLVGRQNHRSQYLKSWRKLKRIAVEIFRTNINEAAWTDSSPVMKVSILRQPQSREAVVGEQRAKSTASKPHLHQQKVLLCVSWIYNGPLHRDLSFRSQSVITARLCQQLNQFQQELVEKGVDTSEISPSPGQRTESYRTSDAGKKSSFWVGRKSVNLQVARTLLSECQMFRSRCPHSSAVSASPKPMKSGRR